MKKIVLSLVFVFGLLAASVAQNLSKNAIGLRLGDNDGFGAEISYQRKLSTNNRLELDLGFRNGKDYDGFKLTGLYQWVWVLDGNFNWYVGVGGGAGSVSFDNKNFDNDNETFAFAAGDIGVEYNFDFPVQIFIDLRPEIGFGNYNDDLDLDIGLGARYKF